MSGRTSVTGLERLFLSTVVALLVGASGVAAGAASGPSAAGHLGGWRATSSMHSARLGHVAVVLRDGEALVAGGFDGAAVLRSAERYDPVGGRWKRTGGLNVARDYATATLLGSGKVLVAGGCCVGAAELYDPGAGAWSLTGELATGRYLHTATLLGNGKVLVAGGLHGVGPLAYSLATAELYDPATGAWAPTGAMHVARAAHTANLLPSGKVLVAGGCYGRRCRYPLASAELYDPATGVWTETASMGTTRSAHAAALLAVGRVLVAGGNAGGRVTELYDPTTATWTRTGDLGAARAWFTATVLSDGRVLAAGGQPGTPAAELYRPAVGAWAATGSMVTGRFEHTGVLLGTGEVLATGGATAAGTITATAELYTP